MAVCALAVGIGVKGLIDLVNRTWERREEIQPDTTTRQRPTQMAIYQLLPKTNCKQCGEPTCWTFALKLVASQKPATACTPLQKPEFSENLSPLEALVGDFPTVG